MFFNGKLYGLKVPGSKVKLMVSGFRCQFSGCDACHGLRVTRYAIRAANLGIK